LNVFKKYPKTSVAVTLFTVTLSLYIIDTIVSNLLHVFLTATLSWLLYCLESWIENGKINETDGAKKESDLVLKLRELVNK
jgi:hypothetical protein